MDTATPTATTGTFDKGMLELVNALSMQINGLLEQRARVLQAYASGAKLGQGNFEWNPQTGEYTFTPTPLELP